MKKHSTLGQLIMALSQDDLLDWFGDRIFYRGLAYQKNGRVSDLGITEDDELVAWVDGTKRYVAVILNDGEGGLITVCTCPYQYDCKHAAALILEYQQLEDEQHIELLSSDDRRLDLIFYEDPDEFYHNEEDECPLTGSRIEEFQKFLNKKTKSQLIELILGLAGKYPEVAEEIESKPQVILGDTAKAVANLHREISRIGISWQWNGYNDESDNEPDYERIASKLKLLADNGQADEVLPLCTNIIKAAIELIEVSNDDGDISMELSVLGPAIVRSLEKSSLPAGDKLIWVLEAMRRDSFDIFEDFGLFLNQEFPQSAWNRFIEYLEPNFSDTPQVSGSEGSDHEYTRAYLARWMIHGLKNAGRTDEIIPFSISEAVGNDDYDRLVGLLIKKKRLDEAEEWIHKGLVALGGRLQGVSNHLREMFGEIKKIRGDYPAAAQLYVEEFVRDPSSQAYEDCEHSAVIVGEWPAVRSGLLLYLETGEAPWSARDWPLPESGLKKPVISEKRQFPQTGNLLAIALLENDPTRILHWYDRRKPGSWTWNAPSDDTVASAVKAKYPHRAVEIWQRKSESLINKVKPSAYEEAARYLRKARKVLESERRLDEWQDYLNQLKEQHKKKRRLQEILDYHFGSQ